MEILPIQQDNLDRLGQLITIGCKNSEFYFNTNEPLKPSVPQGAAIVRNLRAIGRCLADLLSLSERELMIEISKGAGNMPRVLYVAIVKSPNRLSSNPSVTILFDEQGRGVVYGTMRSRKSQPNTKIKPTLCIDSPRSKIRYSELFSNFEEQEISKLDPKRLVKELARFLDLEFQNVS